MDVILRMLRPPPLLFPPPLMSVVTLPSKVVSKVLEAEWRQHHQKIKDYCNGNVWKKNKNKIKLFLFRDSFQKRSYTDVYRHLPLLLVQGFCLFILIMISDKATQVTHLQGLGFFF